MSDSRQRASNNVQVVNRPPEPVKNNKKRNIIIVLAALLTLALLGVGAWYMLSQPDVQEDVIITDQDQQPTAIPDPSPTSEPMERSEVSIQVLNGTGVAGEAGLLEDELEELGYEDIEVDNADDDDHEAAVVTFNEDLSPNIIDEITELLEDFYVDLEIRTESLADFDIVIITGARAGMARATATPTPAVTSTEQAAGSPTPSPGE